LLRVARQYDELADSIDRQIRPGVTLRGHFLRMEATLS